MPKKQEFTDREIEKDIITALKYPPRDSNDSNTKARIVAILIACLLLVMVIINHTFMIWVLILFMPGVIAYIIARQLILKSRINKVSILDYRVSEEVVNNTAKETYVIRHNHVSERITNYDINFENGKTWRIPQENHLWSERHRMSDHAVFQSTHRGDTMIVVTKKLTDTVVMAYNTEIFEYKNNYQLFI